MLCFVEDEIGIGNVGVGRKFGDGVGGLLAIFVSNDPVADGFVGLIDRNLHLRDAVFETGGRQLNDLNGAYYPAFAPLSRR